jgi:YhcH/YjgK/YiaL family protein
MVVNLLEHWQSTFSGPVWKRAFEHIISLSPDAEEGYTHLDGENMFARVMEYDTRGPDEGKLESHRKYIDIQASLIGAEGIDWFPRSSLELKSEYLTEKDVEYYHRPDVVPARADIYTGMFAVLFPEDAHMAQQIVGGETKSMKKVVIKVRLDTIQGA